MNVAFRPFVTVVAWMAAFGLLAAQGASYTTETFTGASNGWTDRDAGEMEVAYAGSVGNPAGSLGGTFADQGGFGFPEDDAFRATAAASSGAFTGNYWATVPGFTSWRFDFLAADILPSALTVSFSDGVNTFTRGILDQVTLLGQWNQILVPLVSFSGWLGASDAAFTSALGAVTQVDINVDRNGSGAQAFYVDNMRISNAAVAPEPTTGMLLGLAMAGAGGFRWWSRRRKTNPA